jgi:hypothetical protein
MPNSLSDSHLLRSVTTRLKPYVSADLRAWAKHRIEAPLVAHDITRLAQIYGTDKWKTGFAALYGRRLAGARRRIRTVLEIGVGGAEKPDAGGGSLRMWKRYLPHAQIYGIDIHAKNIREPRITVFQGSQSDRAFLEKVTAEIGPIDLLIDDGSHIGDHIHVSFESLFPKVRPGGLYVIEDLRTSYWTKYGGGAPGMPGTGIALIKSLTDGMHHGSFEDESYRAGYADEHVASIHMYPRIAFIERRG